MFNSSNVILIPIGIEICLRELINGSKISISIIISKHSETVISSDFQRIF